MSLLGRTVYRALTRMGYELVRAGDYRDLISDIARSAAETANLSAESGRLAHQLASLSSEVQAERSENLRRQSLIDQLEQHKRDLMTQVAGSPHVDYQIVMEYHEKKAAFRDTDPAFFTAYERVAPFTMTSIERLYAMYKSAEYVVRAGIPGDIVECGVWRGGSVMLAALVLASLGDTRRRLWLYDTFEGLPKPDPQKDVDMWGNSQFNEWLKYRRTDESSALADVSVEEVRRNIASTGYPTEKVELVKGMVQRTIPAHQPQEISLLRLDTDWYDSTVCELRHLYPRIAEGGVLIVDDYGHLLGQRQAVDEYFAATESFPLLHRIDYSGRLIIKQSRSTPSNGTAAAGPASALSQTAPRA